MRLDPRQRARRYRGSHELEVEGVAHGDAEAREHVLELVHRHATPAADVLDAERGLDRGDHWRIVRVDVHLLLVDLAHLGELILIKRRPRLVRGRRLHALDGEEVHIDRVDVGTPELAGAQL